MKLTLLILANAAVFGLVVFSYQAKRGHIPLYNPTTGELLNDSDSREAAIVSPRFKEELARVLKSDPSTARCMAAKVASFGLARTFKALDPCFAEQLRSLCFPGR